MNLLFCSFTLYQWAREVSLFSRHSLQAGTTHYGGKPFITQSRPVWGVQSITRANACPGGGAQSITRGKIKGKRDARGGTLSLHIIYLRSRDLLIPAARQGL